MRSTATAALVALALAGLAACGGGDDEAQEEGGKTKAVVGVIPIADVAPLYLGVKKGFFDQEGITVEPKPIQGGAEAVPGVVANELQFAFGNAISLLQAKQRGIDFRFVTEGVQAGKSDADSTNGIMVAKDSDVREASDLEGKTIAVNTLNNLGDVTVKASLEKNGADPSKLKFVEVPFPDMIPALERGSVDAVWITEPFISQAKAAGHRKLLDPFVELMPRLTPSGYFGSARFLDENPEVEERFQRAMNKSLDYARTHEAEVRALIPTYSQIPKEVAAKMPLPYWTSDLNEDSIRQLGELAKKYQAVKGEPDVDGILPKQ
jgi:NitT/TauT family transport system substrate-binding protein